MIIYWETLEKNAADPSTIPDYVASTYFGPSCYPAAKNKLLGLGPSGELSLPDNLIIPDAKDFKFASGAKIERDAGNLKLTPESGKDVLPVIRTKVLAYLSASQTLTLANTEYKVAFDTVEYDVNEDFDLANNRFVAPFNGSYLVTLHFYMDVVADADDYYFRLRKNGEIDLINSGNSAAGTRFHGWGYAKVVKLVVDDYLEMFGKNRDSAGDRFLGATPKYTYMTVDLISVDS